MSPACVLLLSGVFLTLFYEDSTAKVVYHGTYVPLQGREMTHAYRSVLEVFSELAERKIELRILHASLPSRAFREAFDLALPVRQEPVEPNRDDRR